MASHKLMAKIKASCSASTIMAFNGHEYVKYEWRPVPADPKIEAQAKDHPFLDLQPVKESKPVKESEPIKEPDEIAAAPDKKEPAKPKAK